jgi:hypothetical protein
MINQDEELFEFIKKKLENKEKEYSSSIKKLKNILNRKEIQISNLIKELDKEKIKNCFYEYELKRNNIDYSPNIEIKENDIKILSKETKDITLYITDKLDMEDEDTKLTFKKYKGQRKNLVKENPIEQEKLIKKIEEEREIKIIENELDIPLKQLTTKIDELMNNIEIKDKINEDLNELKQLRFKILGKVDLKHYTDFLQTNINSIEKVIKEKKKYKNNKLIKEVSKYLYPLEKRLLFYGNYYDDNIDTKEINMFKLTLEINQNYPKRLTPFNYDEFYNKINNFGLALISLKNILNKNLINPYNVNSIVFIGENKGNDPFSFYILDKIEDNYRYWNMDCRLYNFVSKLREILKGFCIKIFKKIYFDIFSSNKYIKNFEEKSSIFSQDCEQLLQNIFFCCNEEEFWTFITELIYEKCNHKITKYDKMNIKADDKCVKTDFKNVKENGIKLKRKEIVEILNQIFENISEEDKEYFLNKY